MERKIRIILGVGFFICSASLLISMPHNKILIIAIVILLAMSIVYFLKYLFIQYIALLLVLLLSLQTFFGNILIDTNYVSLTPNLKLDRFVVGDALPGVLGKISVQTDSKGFRTTKTVDYGSPALFRIFAIGGSTTEQIYLDDRQTSSYILQCKLEDLLKIPVEVINTGVSGIAALNHLSTLNKIENYYPNLVIIMMGANDWNKQVRNHFKQSIYFFNMIRSKYQFEISPLYKLFKQIFWHFYRINSIDKLIDHGEYYSIQNNSLKRAIRREYRPQNVSNEFSIYTKAIFNKCLQGKFKTLVVAQITSYKDNASDELKRYYWCTPPNEYYTLDFANMVYLANLYNVFVENEARHYGLPFCKTDNIPPTTEAFYDDMHLNSRGANIFADIIYQSILKNSLL